MRCCEKPGRERRRAVRFTGLSEPKKKRVAAADVRGGEEPGWVICLCRRRSGKKANGRCFGVRKRDRKNRR